MAPLPLEIDASIKASTFHLLLKNWINGTRRQQDLYPRPPGIIQVHNPTGPRCPALSIRMFICLSSPSLFLCLVPSTLMSFFLYVNFLLYRSLSFSISISSCLSLFLSLSNLSVYPFSFYFYLSLLLYVLPVSHFLCLGKSVCLYFLSTLYLSTFQNVSVWSFLTTSLIYMILLYLQFLYSTYCL